MKSESCKEESVEQSLRGAEKGDGTNGTKEVMVLTTKGVNSR